MTIRANTSSNTPSETLYRLLKTLRGSLLLSTAAIGIALLLVAVVFNSGLTITQEDKVVAGMLGVFGISAIVAGSSFYVLLKILQRH